MGWVGQARTGWSGQLLLCSTADPDPSYVHDAVSVLTNAGLLWPCLSVYVVHAAKNNIQSAKP